MAPSFARTTPLVGLAAALVLVLAGCSSTAEDGVAVGERAPNVVQPGPPGESGRVLDPTEVPDTEPVPHTEADVTFMQDMIGHHAQAIVMTALVEDRTDDEQLELFVQRMDISQVAEIEQMQSWLDARGEDVPAWDPVFGAQGGHSGGAVTGTGHGDEPMPGMATEDQVAELAAASGEEFDRMFLTMMTTHHRGAVEMVEQLYAHGGGDETEVFAFASHVLSDQGIELERMAGMMAELDA